MSNITLKDDTIEVFSPSLPVTRGMLDNMTEQRKLLKEFVSDHLNKDIDYGIIPGTKKPCLFKPGAEKLRGLFGVNITLNCTKDQLDIANNFAMYNYKAQVLRGDNLISECEGSANSQEQKYKERTVWRWDDKARKKVSIKEATPVCDILNTLQKMAQKRAFVGAVIMATGASDFFTQDIDEPEDARNIGTLPTEEPGPSQVPNVTKVTSKPVENNQSGEIVAQSKSAPKSGNYEAIVSFEEKDSVKEFGFRWNGAVKKWTKQLTAEELEVGFPFEVREVR